MGKIYVVPFWSRVAMMIADHLPSRIRAAVYIDALDSLDDECKPVHEIEDGGIETYRHTVGAVRIETLRREAYSDGLKCTTKEAS